MYLAIYAVSFLAISQLLLIGLYYLAFYRQYVVARLLALLSLCLIATVMLTPGSLGDSFATRYLLERLMLATPAVLWLVAHYFFEDEHDISPLMWLMLLGYQVVRAIGSLFLPDQSQAFGLIAQVSYPFMLGLVVHVIVIALRGESSDLVASRRRLRVPFSIGLGSILAAIIAVSVVVSLMPAAETRSLVQYVSLVSYAALFLFALAVNLATLQIAGPSVSLLGIGRRGQTQQSPEEKGQSVSPRVLNRIRELMEGQKLYRDSHLTVGDLANKVYVGEHKLRRVINKDLGHRNFNQFLNRYRVEEAKKLLLQSERTTIHDIAFEVGYASLSTFNNAFKEITGVTPSAFRNDEGLAAVEVGEALIDPKPKRPVRV